MKVILHVDGDAFFAACEIAARPDLRGKPVVVGWERGIATALTREAKELGVVRGMPVFQIRKLDKRIVILPSNYEIYRIYSNRMNLIVSRYSNVVEAYSIDECFADITDMDQKLGMSYEDIGRALQRDLDIELGLSFSVGIGASKVLAKIASKLQKPHGLTVLTEENRITFLNTVAISKVWGIGPKASQYLQRQGIKTALDFAHMPRTWVEDNCSKPYRDTWHELCGISVDPVSDDQDDQASIMRSETFGRPTGDHELILSELSRNIEHACSTLWQQGRGARHVYFFLKTQSFVYHRAEVELPHSTHTPSEICAWVLPRARELLHAGVMYRTTGVILSHLGPLAHEADLFGVREGGQKTEAYGAMQQVIRRFGEEVMMFGSSLLAMNKRGENHTSYTALLYHGRKYLPIPLLGEVR
jgi:nucleotidyltransferase/DNA polymerase involved in DNA repair